MLSKIEKGRKIIKTKKKTKQRRTRISKSCRQDTQGKQEEKFIQCPVVGGGARGEAPSLV